MKKLDDSMEELKIRDFLKSYLSLYIIAMNKIGISLDQEKLYNLISESKITLFKLEPTDNTTATFNVSAYSKEIMVILDNYKKNGYKRNAFLMLHELTHLSSVNDYKLDEERLSLSDKYSDYPVFKEAKNINSFNAAYGLTGIKEVVAQWCCEKCNNSTFPNPERHFTTISNNNYSILGNNLEVETTFSNKDIYSPLETYVKNYSKSLGYSDFKNFCNDFITGKLDIINQVTNDNVSYLAHIGKLCQAIYMENGFCPGSITSDELSQTIEYLNSKNFNFPGNPESPESEERTQ